ncbi:hypothetical protein NECAME_15640 [Necator americanus]|uniref:Uncharacterized protein n=1 Tax=Necator americanus TaxID=51031 RepID=W2SGP1_NECAM|nr:hypothetical protein NECAME_15640 [Necator americanus]ETN68784.1 hypothetical protein NECAME_15640 [Necator americanus]
MAADGGGGGGDWPWRSADQHKYNRQIELKQGTTGDPSDRGASANKARWTSSNTAIEAMVNRTTRERAQTTMHEKERRTLRAKKNPEKQIQWISVKTWILPQGEFSSLIDYLNKAYRFMNYLILNGTD